MGPTTEQIKRDLRRLFYGGSHDLLTLTKNYSSGRIKKNGIGVASSTNWGE